VAEQISTPELSPLDQIRTSEREVARKLAVAREASAQAVADAHARAVVLKEQAREAGEREGQARYKEIISEAEDEARTILADAHNQAAELRHRGEVLIENAAEVIVSVILGLKGGCDES
jgi:vacuolar-type H+-ATPase subunit H